MTFGGIAVGAFAVTLGAMVLWSGDSDDDVDVATREPRIQHVHGLGIDPADGALMIATHDGLFRLPNGSTSPTRLGEVQDVMGFTVVGRRHFVGSGHPGILGLRAGSPTQLGLIESTNGGETWRIVSLGGDADFHALAYAHDTVYAWDVATRSFMVSSDRKTWDTRSEVAMYSFAVDPTNADRIIAAGTAGLIESRDGGRMWRAFDGPGLALLSWHRSRGLWGVGSEGDVWRQDDGGWKQAGHVPGQPQAFLVASHELFAATHGRSERTTIYESTDDARSWQPRYRARP